MRTKKFVLACAAVLLLTATALAAEHSRSSDLSPPAQSLATHCSDSYCLDWQLLAGGIGPMQSASYRLRSSLGQTMAGLFSGSSYEIQAGYWTGVQSPDRHVYLPLLTEETP